MNESFIFWASIFSVSAIMIGWGVNEHFKRNATKRQRLWEIKLAKFQEVRRSTSALIHLADMRVDVSRESSGEDPEMLPAYYGGYFFALSTIDHQVFQETHWNIPDTFRSRDFIQSAAESPDAVVQDIEEACKRITNEAIGRLISEADQLVLISEKSSDVPGIIIQFVIVFHKWLEGPPNEEGRKLRKEMTRLSVKLTKAMAHELDRTLQLVLLRRREKVGHK